MRSISLLVGLVSGVLWACGGQATPQPQPTAKGSVAPAFTSSTASPEVATNGAASGAAGFKAQPRSATTATMVAGRAPSLSDQQVAAVRIAMHDGQMDQGRLAEQRALNLRVRDFAATLVSKHAVAKERHTELLHRLDMAPVESASSEAVKAEDRETLESLKSASGSSFDEVFLDVEVEQQHRILDAIGNHLIPNTRNPDLKADLVRLVPQFVVNVNEVMEIRRDLAVSPQPSEDFAFTQRVWR
jgi:predicted outer membrane protein